MLDKSHTKKHTYTINTWERLDIMSHICADIHTHTIASGHASTATITDMVKTAAKKQLEVLGISDHGPATNGGGKPSYFRNLKYAPRERMGIRILYGAEANIIDNRGTLDLTDDILDGLDYCIASVHPPIKKPGNIEENTATYIEAMKNPHVQIIGHCSDTHYPVDYHALVKAATDLHVLLEINNSSLSPDGYRGDTHFNDLLILNLCKLYQHPVILSSDSHETKHVGDMDDALSLCKKAEMPEDLILNYCQEKLLNFLKN